MSYEEKKQYTIKTILAYHHVLDSMHGFQKDEYSSMTNEELFQDYFSCKQEYAFKIIDFVRKYYETPYYERLYMFEPIKHDDDYLQFILDVCHHLFQTGGLSFSYLAWEDDEIVNEEMLLC